MFLSPFKSLAIFVVLQVCALADSDSDSDYPDSFYCCPGIHHHYGHEEINLPPNGPRHRVEATYAVAPNLPSVHFHNPFGKGIISTQPPTTTSVQKNTGKDITTPALTTTPVLKTTGKDNTSTPAPTTTPVPKTTGIDNTIKPAPTTTPVPQTTGKDNTSTPAPTIAPVPKTTGKGKYQVMNVIKPENKSSQVNQIQPNTKSPEPTETNTMSASRVDPANLITKVSENFNSGSGSRRVKKISMTCAEPNKNEETITVRPRAMTLPR